MLPSTYYWFFKNIKYMQLLNPLFLQFVLIILNNHQYFCCFYKNMFTPLCLTVFVDKKHKRIEWQ